MIKLSVKLIKMCAYKNIIRYANLTCDTVSFVINSDDNLANILYMNYYSTYHDYIYTKTSIGLHPITGTMFDDCLLVTHHISDIVAFLLSADNFTDWNGISFPEDICIYRKNKTWLKYIYHENILVIQNETESDVSFLKNNNIPFEYTI